MSEQHLTAAQDNQTLQRTGTRLQTRPFSEATEGIHFHKNVFILVRHLFKKLELSDKSAIGVGIFLTLAGMANALGLGTGG